MHQGISILLLAGFGLFFQSPPIPSAQQDQTIADSAQTKYTFQEHIAPLLKTNCSPCHYEGGTVVDKYPFEDYKTVKRLGEKLNTRLKEKEQQALIVDWLKTGAKEK